MRHLHGIPINLTGRHFGLRTKFTGAAASKFCTDKIKQSVFRWGNFRIKKKKTKNIIIIIISPEPNCANRTWAQKNHCIIKQLRLTQRSQLALVLSQRLLRESPLHGLVLWVVLTTSWARQTNGQMDGWKDGSMGVSTHAFPSAELN